MEEQTYSININAKSIIQSQDHFKFVCRRISKQEAIAFIKQFDYENENQDQDHQLIIKCFTEAQYWFGYSLFKTLEPPPPEQAVANIKIINIQREQKMMMKLSDKLNLIIKRVSDLINDPGYKKYHQHIQWVPEILKTDDYQDFLLQVNEIYALMQKTSNTQQGFVLLHQNFNEDCDRLLHVASFCQHLNYLASTNENEQQKMPRMVYLNLTGKETQKNLNFWSCFNQGYQKSCQYYALMPPINTPNFDREGSVQLNSIEFQQQLNIKLKYEGLIPNVYQHTFIPLYIPPDQENRELKKEFIDQIYLDVLRKKFKDFNPNYIFIDLMISSQFSIEDEGLESLVRKLSKIAKVVVHIKFEPNMQPQSIVLLQKLNAIIYGMQGLKSVRKIKFNQSQDKQIEWLKNQSLLISQYNKKCGELIFTHCQYAKQTEKKYKVKTTKYYYLQIYLEGKLAIIIPKNQKNEKIEYGLERISYQNNLIVLFSTDKETIYFKKFPLNQNQNGKQSAQQCIELNFQEIKLPKKLVEPSIMIIENHIILAYGHEFIDGQFVFNDSIIIIDSQKLEMKTLQRSEWVHFKDENNVNAKTHFDSTPNVVERIKNRRGQQACENTVLLKREFLSFLLIGGESRDTQEFSLMNIIECIMIDLSNGKFTSQIMNKSQLSKLTSLKPWPYQVVLSYCTEQQQQTYALILSGNNQNKLNQYSLPLNPNHHNYAQLLVKQDNKIQLLNIQVKTGENYLRIEKIMNSQYNQILIEKNNDRIVWKVFFKRIIQFKKPNLSKDLAEYEKLIQSNNFNNLVLVYLEYQVILKIKDNNLFISDNYEVEITSVVQSIQNMQD